LQQNNQLVRHSEGTAQTRIIQNAAGNVIEEAGTPGGSLPTSIEITFNPGKVGIRAHQETGRIEWVDPEAQASQLGVQAGWFATKIDDEDFKKDLLLLKTRGSDAYSITFVLS